MMDVWCKHITHLNNSDELANCWSCHNGRRVHDILISSFGSSVLCCMLQWHSLDKAEQARYYEMARREKELHRKRYPTWSARDNYAMHSRRRRKRVDHRPLLRRDGLCDDDGMMLFL